MKTGITMEQMAVEVTRQFQAKQDYLVKAGNIRMETYGGDPVLRLLDEDGLDQVEPLDIKSTAHQQLGTYLNIPSRYYDRMLTEYPDLLTHNVNSWLQRNQDQKMLRTLDGSARALLSNRYWRVDHMDILQAVLPIIDEMPEVRVESCEITDVRMYLKFVNPRLQVDVVPGDTVQAGIVISNSEVGMGAVLVQPLIYRLVCSNGMVVNDAKTRRNHVGRVTSSDENFLIYSEKTLQADDHAFILKLQDTVRAAVDEARFSRVVDAMKDAASAKLNTADVPGVIKLAGSAFGLRETEQPGILQHLIDGQDMSLYGLANAVTRFSQDVESYDRATELESVGYDVLTMPRRQWNNINQDVGQALAA